jgi:O-antigen/teichoic acid export membrane protein
MTDRTQQVGSAVFWNVLAKTGRFGLSLVSGVIVVRCLGPDDYGVLSLVRMILTFTVILAGAGLGQALLKYLPVLRVSGSAGEASRLAKRIVFFQICFWAVLIAAVFLARPVFDRLFRFEFFGSVGPVILAAAVLSLFELFFNLVSSILSACYDTKQFSLVNILNQLIFIGVLVVVLKAGLGVLGVLVAGAVGNLAACVILLPKTGSNLAGTGLTGGGGTIPNGRLFRFSLPFAAIGVLNMIVWRQSETIFLAHFRTAAETGFFDLAYRLPQTMLEFIPTAVWPVIMAGFSELYEKDHRSLGAAIGKYYRMLFLLCAPVCLGGIVFGGRLIPLLFGEAMAPAAPVTQLFFGIFTISFFSTPLSMSLYVIEKTHINLIICAALAVLNVGLDIVLIPRYGLMGAVYPVAAVIAISPLLYHFALSRFLSDYRIPFSFIGRCFLASAPLIVLYPVVAKVDDILMLTVTILAGVFIWVLSFKRFKVLGKEEMDLLAKIPISAAGRLFRFLSS